MACRHLRQLRPAWGARVWLLRFAQELGVHMCSLYARNALSVSPGGHLDPVGMHIHGHLASEPHSWERWPVCAHALLCPAPRQRSPCECSLRPRDLASLLFPL